MKKAFIFGAMVCVFILSANAQLGKPTTNVKDTFCVKAVYYNGMALNRPDWPDTIIVEDALKIYVANYVYVKGKAKKKLGYFTYYDATCNGKVYEIGVTRDQAMTDEWEIKYSIGEYVFVTTRKKKLLRQSQDEDQSYLFIPRGNKGLVTDDNMETEQEWYESQSMRLEMKDGKSRREILTIKRQAMFNGRRAMIPIPQLNGDINGAQGKVVVKVWVDRNGNVLKAECPAEGSTTTDEALVAATREAVLKARFSTDENAPEEQVVTVTIIFETEITNR